MKRVWLEDMVLMVQRVVQAPLGLLVIQVLQVFRVCLGKEVLLELLVPRVTGVV